MRESFTRQRRFLVDLWGKMPEEDRRVAETKDLAVHLLTEVSELLNCLPFKSHRLDQVQEVVKGNLLEEMVDIYKYLVGMALVWGIDGEEFEDAFEAKSDVVEQRLKQERFLASLPPKSLLVIDLDGVALNTHNSWLSFLAFHTGNAFNTRLEARMALGNYTYEQLKHNYRLWHKAEVPLMPGVQDLQARARSAGLAIAYVSARPYSRYSNLFVDTTRSLEKTDYDILIFDDHKRRRLMPFIHSVATVVEDDLSQAISLVNPWTTVYLLSNAENAGSLVPEPIKLIHTLDEVTFV